MLGSPFDSLVESTLVFLHTRINLSPFTKDFRGGEQLNESIDQFFVALPSGGAPKTTRTTTEATKSDCWPL